MVYDNTIYPQVPTPQTVTQSDFLSLIIQTSRSDGLVPVSVTTVGSKKMKPLTAKALIFGYDVIVNLSDILKEPYTKAFQSNRKTTLSRVLYSHALFFKLIDDIFEVVITCPPLALNNCVFKKTVV